MRYVLRIVITVAAMVAMLIAWDDAMAHADVGGQQVSPGNCPYPAVGPFGFDGVAEHYACDDPTEINGSHRRCIFGGAATSVVGSANLLIFNIGFVQPVGVLEGACYWACPDENMAAEPNPIGTWQGSSSATTPVVRSACKTIAPNPFANRALGAPTPPEPPAPPPGPPDQPPPP